MPSPSPLLDVRALKTWFPVSRGIFSRIAGYVKAVNGVSFSIAAGEIYGVVGESGCGKSTLGRTIVGLERPREGEIRVRGRSIHELRGGDAQALRRSMQIVFQDPYASLNPRMTIADIVTEAMMYHRLIAKRDKQQAAARVLQSVGLDENAVHRYPHEFSGGQRQRICIARAIALQPNFVVCDEAVSALDVSVQAQIINLLLDLRDERNLSYLFISHDLNVVSSIANRIAVMYLGHIIEEGAAADVVKRPLHPYTQALLSAVPRPGKEKKQRIVLQGEIPSPLQPPTGCPFHTRCAQVMARCRSEFPQERMADGRRVSCHLY